MQYSPYDCWTWIFKGEIDPYVHPLWSLSKPNIGVAIEDPTPRSSFETGLKRSPILVYESMRLSPMSWSLGSTAYPKHTDSCNMVLHKNTPT